MIRRTTVLALSLCLALSACGSHKPATQTLSSPSPTTSGACTPSGTGTTDLAVKPVIKAPSGPAPTETTWTDIVCGTGPVVKDGMKIDVKYVGALLSTGKEFESSWAHGDTTITLTIGPDTLPGFAKGLAGMRIGGRRQIVMPSKDAYGDTARGPIPAGSAVVFVIDLVRVHPAPKPVPCKASGTGTTDLKKKPVVQPRSATPPATTQVIDIVCGKGAQAEVGSQVKVRYLGVLYTSAKEFDSSWSRGYSDLFPFTVGSGVVQGFSTGVTGMRVGGRREVIIPASEGYGAAGSPPSIPANAALVFVIDLVSVG